MADEVSQKKVVAMRTFADDVKRVRGGAKPATPKHKNSNSVPTAPQPPVPAPTKEEPAPKPEPIKDKEILRETKEDTAPETVDGVAFEPVDIPPFHYIRASSPEDTNYDDAGDIPDKKSLKKATLQKPIPPKPKPQQPLIQPIADVGVDLAEVPDHQSSVLSNKDGVFDTEEAEQELGEGSIVLDRKHKRFKLLPAIGASLSAWFGEKVEKVEEARKPKHEVTKASRRKDVITAAATKTKIAPADDHKVVTERLQNTERVNANNELMIKRPEEVAKPTWDHVVPDKQERAVGSLEAAINEEGVSKTHITHTENDVALPPTEKLPVSPKNTEAPAEKSSGYASLEDTETSRQTLQKEDVTISTDTPQAELNETAHTSRASLEEEELSLKLQAKLAQEKTKTLVSTPVPHKEPEPNPAQRSHTSASPVEALAQTPARTILDPRVNLSGSESIQKQSSKTEVPQENHEVTTEEPTEKTKSKEGYEAYREKYGEHYTPKEEQFIKTETPTPVSEQDVDRPVFRETPVPQERLASTASNTSPQTSTVPYLTIFAVIFAAIVLGVSATTWWFTRDVVTSTTNELEAVVTLFESQATAYVPLSTNATAFNQSLATAANEKQGTTAVLLPMIGDTPASATDIFATLSPQAPGSFVRNVSHISYGSSVGEPFIVLEVASFDTAFGGMLIWEPNMVADLAPLFGNPARTNVYDTKVSNHDVRVLTSDGFTDTAVYGFVDKHTILITSSRDQFERILPIVK